MCTFRARTLAVFLSLSAVICLLSGCHPQTGPVIRSPQDAAKARIGVMTGSTGEMIVNNRFPQSDMQTFDDVMNAVAAIEARKLDAVVTAFPTAQQITKRHPELYLVPEPLDREDTSVAVKKGNDALLNDVNRIIAHLKADGTLAGMRKRWLKADLSPYQIPRIEVPERGTPLRIGVSATREPLSFIDAEGNVTGHDGELARRIAAELHRPVEFQNMKFMTLIPALKSGKIDLILTGMTATDERRKSVDFSIPYFESSQVLLAFKPPSEGGSQQSASGQGKLRSPADLADKRIGVLMGSADSPYATQHYPDAKVLEFKSSADIVLAVKAKKVDAAFYDAEPLRIVLRQEPSLAAMNEDLFSFDVGVGFRKQNALLRDEFNHFLAGIQSNGLYAAMIKRWMEEGDTTMPPIELPSTGKPLLVAVADVGLPFIAVKDNRLVGFDIELATRFAAALGRPVQFDNMDFDGLIAAAASGKDDLIISSIYITDERKKQIAFSEPYYAMGTKVFALKESLAAAGQDANHADTAAAMAAPGEPSFFAKTAASFHSNFVLEKRYLLIWDGLKTTIIISILSTIFGTLLGALICFMRMSKLPMLYMPAIAYIDILRGTPVLVLLMLIFYVVFASVNISPVLVAVIAFGMNFAAYVSEIFRAGIESIDRGQSEAAIAIGFTPVQSFLHIILPQTVQRILPVYKGEFISLVKMTSIVGYIAVQDLTKASDIIRSRTFDAFFPLIIVAIIYFLIAWLFTIGLEQIEKRTSSRSRRIRGATR